MPIKETLENNIVVVIVVSVVAACGATWAVAEKVRIAPKDEQIAILSGQLAKSEQTLAELTGTPHEPDEDCADKILKAIELLKSRTKARLRIADVDAVQRAVQELDPGRREKILSHVPNRDWSGVAEDLTSPFNGERSAMAELILRYFPSALQAIGADKLRPPEIEIVWPEE